MIYAFEMTPKSHDDWFQNPSNIKGSVGINNA
jgi:hypothetical protein